VSDHKLLDVGTSGTFKVPSLIAVGYRAPYLHNGCAATLLDRFNPACGGGDQHGHTSQLTPSQLSDLVAYLESL
jgi:cytochrome c peroxidase